jgi:hypothetical protein
MSRPDPVRSNRPPVQVRYAARRVFGPPGVARFVLTVSLVAALTVGAARAEEAPEGPTYPELAGGESSLWIDVGGVAGWFTDRAPLSAFSPLVLGVGYGHRVGVVRLGWRVHVLSNPGGDRKLRFLYGDLLSLERVYGEGTWRPYWRVALGFALDLEGEGATLGDEGYFNAASGAAGGLGLAHGWGLDAFVSDAWFVRTEATLRVHGAAGRTGVLWAGHLGVGRTF